MNYLIWRTPQYNSSHWNQGTSCEFLEYFATFVKLFTMMDEEGNYLSNVLQYFSVRLCQGQHQVTGWMKSDWSTQTPKAKEALSWVCSVEISFVRDSNKLFHTRARSGHSYWSNQSQLTRVTKTSFLNCARNFTSSFCHIFADFLPVFAQAVVEQCGLILGRVRQVSHARHVDWVIQKWFGHS